MSHFEAKTLSEKLSSFDFDLKLNELKTWKTRFKKERVDQNAISVFIVEFKNAAQSSNVQISTASMQCLFHLLKRVNYQPDSFVIKNLHQPLASLLVNKFVEKDQRKELAINALVELYGLAASSVELEIVENGFCNKNLKIKVASLNWLVKIHSTRQDFAIKAYTNSLTLLLEDPNEQVRETAVCTITSLFKESSDAAKHDLNIKMKQNSVRKSIINLVAENVNSRILSTSKNIANIKLNSAYVGQLFSNIEKLEPLILSSPKLLDSIIADMQFAFNGKESEHNWTLRDKHITAFRRLIRGYYSSELVNGLKDNTSGILKALHSLRTTLCLNAAILIREIVFFLPQVFDTTLEIYIEALLKIISNTKKIAVAAAHLTICVLLDQLTFQQRIMQHLITSADDKNSQQRQHCQIWMLVLLETHYENNDYSSSLLDFIEKVTSKGLSDPNLVVRTNARVTYSHILSINPERAENIRNSLDIHSRKQLEKLNVKNKVGTTSKISRQVKPLAEKDDVIYANNFGLSSGAIKRGLGLPQRSNLVVEKSIKTSRVFSEPLKDETGFSLENYTKLSIDDGVNSFPVKGSLMERISHEDRSIREAGINSLLSKLQSIEDIDDTNSVLSNGLPNHEVLQKVLRNIISDPIWEISDKLLNSNLMVTLTKLLSPEEMILLIMNMKTTTNMTVLNNSRSCEKALLDIISSKDFIIKSVQLLTEMLTPVQINNPYLKPYNSVKRQGIIREILISLENHLSNSTGDEIQLQDRIVWFTDLLPLIYRLNTMSTSFSVLLNVQKLLYDNDQANFSEITQDLFQDIREASKLLVDKLGILNLKNCKENDKSKLQGNVSEPPNLQLHDSIYNYKSSKNEPNGKLLMIGAAPADSKLLDPLHSPQSLSVNSDSEIEDGFVDEENLTLIPITFRKNLESSAAASCNLSKVLEIQPQRKAPSAPVNIDALDQSMYAMALDDYKSNCQADRRIISKIPISPLQSKIKINSESRRLSLETFDKESSSALTKNPKLSGLRKPSMIFSKSLSSPNNLFSTALKFKASSPDRESPTLHSNFTRKSKIVPEVLFKTPPKQPEISDKMPELFLEDSANDSSSRLNHILKFLEEKNYYVGECKEFIELYELVSQGDEKYQRSSMHLFNIYCERFLAVSYKQAGFYTSNLPDSSIIYGLKILKHFCRYNYEVINQRVDNIFEMLMMLRSKLHIYHQFGILEHLVDSLFQNHNNLENVEIILKYLTKVAGENNDKLSVNVNGFSESLNLLSQRVEQASRIECRQLLPRIGRILAKTIELPAVEIRRFSVMTGVALYKKLSDADIVFEAIEGLNEDKKKLLDYYFYVADSRNTIQ